MDSKKHTLDDSEFEINVEAAQRTLIVYAIVRADTSNRYVRADGIINGRTFATATAQDATAPGVPSVNMNSFTLVVPPGVGGSIRLVNGGRNNLIVQSYYI